MKVLIELHVVSWNSVSYSKLMVVLKDYIDKVNMVESHEFLLKAMKSLEYIFKFIIRSRILFAA